MHAAPSAAAPPERVDAAASDGRLDILVLYTAEAARKWAPLGGTQASIRNAVDYLNMVLRNGRINLTARAVHTAQAPAVLDRVGRDGLAGFSSNLFAQLNWNGDVAALRIRHKADVVHLFSGESWRLIGNLGVAGLLMRGDSAASFSPRAYGYTVIDGAEAKTFAHEVGHNLGANHQPDFAGPPSQAVKPWAFGHIYSTRGGEHGTAMTYAAHVEPWFSSTRIAPAGYRIGVAGQRDNERALRETTAMASRFADSLVTPGSPNAPSDVRVEALDGSSMRVSWRDNSSDEDGFEVSLARFGRDPYDRRRAPANARSVNLASLEPGVHVVTVHAYNGNGLSPLGGAADVTLAGWAPSAPFNVRVTALSDSTAEVSWSHDDPVFYEIHTLRDGEVWRRTHTSAGARSRRVPVKPGARYGFRVSAYTRIGGHSAPSRTVFRNFPAAGAGIAAPTGLRATILDATTVRLDWTDNASNETGYTTVMERWAWSSTVRLKANRSSYVYRGLRPGELYTAAVTVYGEDGSQARVETGFALPAAAGGPAAPTGLTWDAASGRLTWIDNSSDEEGFEVQYREPPEISRWKRLVTLPANQESHTATNRYGWDYRVVAWNAAGVSASDAVRTGSPPPTPAGFSAVPAGASGVDLTWTDEWAEPARGTLTIEARTARRSGWSQVASAPATAGAARVSGLDRNAPYTFRLRSGAETSGYASATTGDPVSTCRSGQPYLCLRERRFEVRVHWSNPDRPGNHGAGTAVPVEISDESGLFWFFDPAQHRTRGEGPGRPPRQRRLLGVLRRPDRRGVLDHRRGHGGRRQAHLPQSPKDHVRPERRRRLRRRRVRGRRFRARRRKAPPARGDPASTCRRSERRRSAWRSRRRRNARPPPPGSTCWRFGRRRSTSRPSGRNPTAAGAAKRTTRPCACSTAASPSRSASVDPNDGPARGPGHPVADHGEDGLLLVLQRLEHRTGDQAARRPGDQRPLLVPLRRPLRRRVRNHRDGHRDQRGQDLPQRGREHLRADRHGGPVAAAKSATTAPPSPGWFTGRTPPEAARGSAAIPRTALHPASSRSRTAAGRSTRRPVRVSSQTQRCVKRAISRPSAAEKISKSWSNPRSVAWTVSTWMRAPSCQRSGEK